MSLFVGYAHRKIENSSIDEVESFAHSLKAMKHDRYEECIYKNVVFSYLDSKDKIVLTFLDDQELLFAAQGRVDNRAELCALLQLHDDKCQSISDAELILQIYLYFREDAPNKILGDWSFAVYDFKKSRLFLSQDPHGYTSLYYYIDNDVVIFSNTIEPLLASNKVTKKLNLDKVLSFASSYRYPNKDETCYQEIKLLNPAHSLWVDATKHKKERYWFPENLPLNHEISAEAAAEQLKEIFTEAVRCRLPKNKSVASMLSGGLDSGSVCAVASSLLKKSDTQLHTFSHVPYFDVDNKIMGKHRYGDESPYIQETVQHVGNIIPHYIDSREITSLESMRNLMKIVHQPIHGAISAYWLVDLPLQARKMQFDTLLSGEMGNATISFTGITHALSVKRLLKLNGFKSTLKLKLLKPLYYKYVKPLYYNIFHSNTWQDASYLHPKFAKKIQLKDKIKKSSLPSYYTDAKEMQLQILMIGYNPRCLLGSLLSHNLGITWSDPTGDKRVIEFMLQLPNELFFSDSGDNKQILKLMMRDLLPDKVLFQNKKGLQSADSIERLQQDIPEIESIITSFSNDYYEDVIFDKDRMLYDLQLLKEKQLSFSQVHILMKAVGIIEFINMNNKKGIY